MPLPESLQRLRAQIFSGGDKDENDPRKRMRLRGRPVPSDPQPPPPQRGAFYESRQAQPRQEPQYMVGPGAAYIPVENTAPRERPLPAANPGAYDNFADYVNAVEGLTVPGQRQADVVRGPDWTQQQDIERSRYYVPLARGETAPDVGLEPPDATEQLTPAYLAQRDPNYRFEGRYLGGDRALRSSWLPVPQPPASAYQPIERQSQAETENAAWNAALAQVRAEMDAERRAEMARIPRPGYPLIAQAWSDPPGALRRRRDGR